MSNTALVVKCVFVIFITAKSREGIKGFLPFRTNNIQ